MGNVVDEANGANADKVAAAEGPKAEVGIWPVLAVVIAGGLIADEWF